MRLLQTFPSGVLCIALSASVFGCNAGNVTASAIDGSANLPPAEDASPGAWDARVADAQRPAPEPCTAVAHIGDSLTAGVQPELINAYASVGAAAQIDAYGGRAILQKLPADPKTGKQAALDFNAVGFVGCWVVAMGTNDTADIAAGAGYSRGGAIDEMLNAIDASKSARVMWVNTFTTRDSGYWSNGNMALWNQALEEAKLRWPNLVVFDWASIAATGSAPYVDGIHHTTAGYGTRNASIAQALLAFYPAH